MSMFILAISCLTTSNLPWFMDLTFKDPRQYWCVGGGFLASDFTFTPKLIYSWVSFPLWPCHFILSGRISNGHPLLTISILDTFWPRGAYLTVSCLFAFSYCPWCSLGKNTGVVYHFLLQWTMFCQNSSLWPVCLRWSCREWFLSSLSYLSPFAFTGLWSVKDQGSKVPQTLKHGPPKRLLLLISQ